MKPLDLDGQINGRESRGLLCVECGQVIAQGATDACPDQVDIDRARELASAAHAGQRYSGDDYFERHVADVVRRVRLDELAACQHVVTAWLHDVVEDSDTVLADLDFSDEVVLAVDAITRRKSEPYRGYILRCAENEIASVVKRHDLQSNLNADTPESLVVRNRHALKVLKL